MFICHAGELHDASLASLRDPLRMHDVTSSRTHAMTRDHFCLPGEDKGFAKDLCRDLTKDLKLAAFLDELSLDPGCDKVLVRCSLCLNGLVVELFAHCGWRLKGMQIICHCSAKHEIEYCRALCNVCCATCRKCIRLRGLQR